MKKREEEENENEKKIEKDEYVIMRLYWSIFSKSFLSLHTLCCIMTKYI